MQESNLRGLLECPDQKVIPHKRQRKTDKPVFRVRQTETFATHLLRGTCLAFAGAKLQIPTLRLCFLFQRF